MPSMSSSDQLHLCGTASSQVFWFCRNVVGRSTPGNRPQPATKLTLNPHHRVNKFLRPHNSPGLLPPERGRQGGGGGEKKRVRGRAAREGKMTEKQTCKGWKRWTNEGKEKEPGKRDSCLSPIKCPLISDVEKRREGKEEGENLVREVGEAGGRGDERQESETICFCHFLARSTRYGLCHINSTHLLLFLLLLLLPPLPSFPSSSTSISKLNWLWHWDHICCPCKARGKLSL